jgi:hypothetical protein
MMSAAFHDGLTPSLTVLYPKGIPWPGQAKEKAAKKTSKKTPAKKAARPCSRVDAEGRTRIADAMKKRWADRRKAVAK